jgi:hypothetical protein
MTDGEVDYNLISRLAGKNYTVSILWGRENMYVSQYATLGNEIKIQTRLLAHPKHRIQNSTKKYQAIIQK